MGLRDSHLLPGALLDCPLARLSPAPCPQSAPASRCDLVEMVPLLTCCQGPDGAGSGTCQQSPLQVWAAVGSACAVSARCVTLGSTHPLLVTGGLIRNPGLRTNSVPLRVGKHSKSQACGVLGSGGSGGRAVYRTSRGGWLACGSSRHTVGPSSLSEDWGAGSQDCVEAFAHSSLCTGLMLLGEGWPLFPPGPWTGVGWAAGGLATYPLGMASSPEPPPIPRDVARSRIPEKGHPGQSRESCGAQGHPGSSPPASTEHSSQEPGVALVPTRLIPEPAKFLPPCSLLSTSLHLPW